MDNPPEEQEHLYQALYNCNQSLSDDNRFVVPFICVSAVPYGRLYKENLEDIPTVTDTYNALLNYDKTNPVAISLIKYALHIAACPSERIEQIEGASVQETSLHGDHNDELSRGLRFHKLLIDIINGLPSNLKRQVISASSGHLLSNPIHTELLHVQFLQLIQRNVIGRRDVTKLHNWIESIGRNDILDLIDSYCSEVEVPVLPRKAIQPPTERPLAEGIYQQPIQETERETSGPKPAINRSWVHKMEPHIVEQDNPTGPTQDRTELGSCANGGDYAGEPECTASATTATPCDHARHKGRKKKSCVLISLPTILVAICFLFLVFEFYPPTSGQTILQASDVVRLSSHGFDPFHYSTVTVTRNDSKTPAGDASRVKFYLQTCSKLVPSDRPIRTKVTHIDSSNEDHTFFVYQGYLLKGSNVSFDVNITAHTEFAKCSAALYIFQEYECFVNFLNFGSDVNDCSTRRTCLRISSTLDQQPPYVFTADETSYYFAALSAPSGTEGVDDIYFQTTGMQLYYTTGDLPPDCSMITGINSSCSLSLPGSQAFQVSLGNTVCVLAVMMADNTDTTSSENNTVPTYLTYSSTTACNPVHNTAKIVTLLAILVVATVTVVVFCICCSKCRSRDRPYHKLPTDQNPVQE